MTEPKTEATAGLHQMVAEMEACRDARLYFPAILVALALPDICGALGSDNGRSTGPKYKRWAEEWLPDAGYFSAGLWALRCSLLHQGSAQPENGGPRVAFSINDGPNGVDLHGPGAILEEINTGDRMTPISARSFVTEVAAGVSAWVAKYGSTSIVLSNLEKSARLRKGVPLHFADGTWIA